MIGRTGAFAAFIAFAALAAICAPSPAFASGEQAETSDDPAALNSVETKKKTFSDFSAGLALFYGSVNPKKRDDEETSALGFGFEALYRLYGVFFAAARFDYLGADVDGKAQKRLTTAGGLSIRLDSLIVYPEIKALIGSESLREGSSWNNSAILFMSLGVFVGAKSGLAAGVSVSERLLFSEIYDNAGAFLSLFSKTARYKSVDLSIRWNF